MNRGFADEEVRKSIVFYRGRTTDIGNELKEIRQSLQGRHNLNIARQIHLIFTDWDVGKPCLLMFIQFTFETFCGGVVLTQFAQSVFQQAVQSLSPINCTQILAALQMAAIAGSGYLLQLFGRKTILIGAAVLTCSAQLVVAAFFQFEDTLGSQQWLVVVGIVVANAASNGGISQLSHLFLGELLPTRVRQMVGSAVSLYMGALSAVFIHLFPVLTSAVGSAGLFAVLAAVNVLQVTFAYFCLPETRGLSLEEVQVRHFSSKKKMEAEKAIEQREQEVPSIEIITGDSLGGLRNGMKTPSNVNTTNDSHSGNNENPKADEKQHKGTLNAAYEDTEQGLRRRKTSDRSESECYSSDCNSQRKASTTTLETPTDKEMSFSQIPLEDDTPHEQPAATVEESDHV
ncbi:facilitated trehalose transporter Tret1-2 homolog [Amphibalanus amphitrite]|uniref:facilitated trehalose transporter Tret1-2 homolog n=1 Tax=Amphibalanus amphitrite TaxID=1232801 RepID=UPI001C927E22|nr:facilitated trehalose transporter Tret1-2 homolog [Amphibalanus amphitrite]